MSMFTLRDAAALIPGATVMGDDSVAFERVSTDSRSAGPGDLFVAIKGDRFDAHDFLPEVAARNVTAALVTRTPDGGRARRRADLHVRLRRRSRCDQASVDGGDCGKIGGRRRRDKRQPA